MRQKGNLLIARIKVYGWLTSYLGNLDGEESLLSELQRPQIHISFRSKIVFPGERKSGRDMVMKKADTGKVKVVREDALIVAVDIGMEMNRGYCTTPDGRNTKTYKFENTREGLDTLWGMIIASKNRFKCNEVIVGYESTGPYGEPPNFDTLKATNHIQPID